jgi:hypothetical protein
VSAVDRLIEAAGGPVRLAEAIAAARPADKVSREDVYNWRRRGRIPGRFLVTVARLAIPLGCAEVVAELDTAAARRRPRRKAGANQTAAQGAA